MGVYPYPRFVFISPHKICNSDIFTNILQNDAIQWFWATVPCRKSSQNEQNHGLWVKHSKIKNNSNKRRSRGENISWTISSHIAGLRPPAGPYFTWKLGPCGPLAKGPNAAERRTNGLPEANNDDPLRGWVTRTTPQLGRGVAED